MKKKNSGLNLGTVLTAVSCLAAAVLFWLFAKYLESDSAAIAFIANIAYFTL